MRETEELRLRQEAHFLEGHTLPVERRKENIRHLVRSVREHERDLTEALRLDLGKSEAEAWSTEIGIVYSEARNTLRHLDSWAKRKRVRTALLHFPSHSYILKEPVGNVLIMSPWNYPVQLTLVPLIGALAAGCTAIVKPSRYSENTSLVLQTIVSEALDERDAVLFLGGRAMNEEVLSLKYDRIFFTGSPSVGKIVMQKGAETLTPVTLELGGKSPCFITKSADMSVTCSRLAFGKLLNSGQTCVAPDYVLIHKDRVSEFLETFPKYIRKYYGDDVFSNPEYGKIINDRHFERINSLIEGSTVFCGGASDRETRKIQPTVLYPVKDTDPVMQEEIFGPVLPVIEYERIEEAVKFVSDRPHPLALYVFGKDRSEIELIHSRIRFGGGCVNDTIMHLVSHDLPFGGFGESGTGSYHGKRSFDTFTHEKGILVHGLHPDITIRCAPWTDRKKKLTKLMLK